MASIDLIEKEATKLSIISLSLACLIVVQLLMNLVFLIFQSQIMFLVIQSIIPLAILVMNAYALILAVRYPEFDRKIPIAGTAISLALIIYMIIMFIIF